MRAEAPIIRAATVAEEEGRVLGYAYASAFVDRAAYDRTAAVHGAGSPLQGLGHP